jgi:hypothetical protein
VGRSKNCEYRWKCSFCNFFKYDYASYFFVVDI